MHALYKPHLARVVWLILGEYEGSVALTFELYGIGPIGLYDSKTCLNSFPKSPSFTVIKTHLKCNIVCVWAFPESKTKGASILNKL